MIAVDNNVLSRYLLHPSDDRNPQWQSLKAIDIINSADSVFISDIVLSEVKWVMDTVFELDKKQIHQTLFQLTSQQQFRFEDWNALHCALIDYQTYPKVDFSDCLIARQAASKNADTLYTFESSRKLCTLHFFSQLLRLFIHIPTVRTNQELNTCYPFINGVTQYQACTSMLNVIRTGKAA